jgi:hypothetical protein
MSLAPYAALTDPCRGPGFALLLAFPGLAEAVVSFPGAVVRVALMFTAGLVGFYRPVRDAFLVLPKEQGQIR